jgi:ankyrin repeat protein
VIKWLFAQGVEREPPAPTEWMSSSEDTPLMAAIGHNLVDIAILLINHGADVNHKSRSGYYPIYAAIKQDRDPKLLEALLAHGADPTRKFEDQTAMELAERPSKYYKLKHRERFLELLKGAANVSAAAR